MCVFLWGLSFYFPVAAAVLWSRVHYFAKGKSGYVAIAPSKEVNVYHKDDAAQFFQLRFDLGGDIESPFHSLQSQDLYRMIYTNSILQ